MRLSLPDLPEPVRRALELFAAKEVKREAEELQTRRTRLAAEFADLTAELDQKTAAHAKPRAAALAALNKARAAVAHAEQALAQAEQAARQELYPLDHRLDLVRAELVATAPEAIEAFRQELRHQILPATMKQLLEARGRNWLTNKPGLQWSNADSVQARVQAIETLWRDVEAWKLEALTPADLEARIKAAVAALPAVETVAPATVDAVIQPPRHLADLT